MGKIRTDRWCILRTSGRHTMQLAETLAADGFEVWTPIETKTIRIPRSNVRREIRSPIMPSYVFAREAHLIDLLQMAEAKERPRRGTRQPAHASFSVLHAFGRIPMVADAHLGTLRRLEAKRTPIRKAAYAYPRNSRVKMKDGPFGGMTGLVVRSTPGKTVLCFGKGIPVEIPTSLLTRDAVECHQVPVRDAA